jgi:hypothetical protein
VAARLRLSIKTIRRMRKEGKLLPRLIDTGSTRPILRYPVKDIEKYERERPRAQTTKGEDHEP